MQCVSIQLMCLDLSDASTIMSISLKYIDIPGHQIRLQNLRAARFESLAYFSSIGPTSDGRLKPDIIAPGTTVSATPQ